MSVILNIDTTAEQAYVTVASKGVNIATAINENMKEHAAFLHPAIKQTIRDAGLTLPEIDAVAVNHGPGSYTGIRVGMAAAKGCSYALRKPLITISALNIIAASVVTQITVSNEHLPILICPMIDARRMEVFTALYDAKLTLLEAPSAQIITGEFLVKHLLTNQIIFAGSGSGKWKAVNTSKNAIFPDFSNSLLSMSNLSYQHFIDHNFSSLVLAEALYIKEFYSGHNPA